MATRFHPPVLLGPLLDAIGRPTRAVDATLGDGGHADALRSAGAAGLRVRRGPGARCDAALRSAGAEVLGIDRDPDAIAQARQRLGDTGMDYLTASYGSETALAAVA